MFAKNKNKKLKLGIKTCSVIVALVFIDFSSDSLCSPCHDPCAHCQGDIIH